jgi:hypothetical protein
MYRNTEANYDIAYVIFESPSYVYHINYFTNVDGDIVEMFRRDNAQFFYAHYSNL